MPSDWERACAITNWPTVAAEIADLLALVRLEERERLRGSEVIPLVRQLCDVEQRATDALRSRRWVRPLGQICGIVQGCRLVWPDLFDQADALERTADAGGRAGSTPMA